MRLQFAVCSPRIDVPVQYRTWYVPVPGSRALTTVLNAESRLSICHMHNPSRISEFPSSLKCSHLCHIRAGCVTFNVESLMSSRMRTPIMRHRPHHRSECPIHHVQCRKTDRKILCFTLVLDLVFGVPIADPHIVCSRP